MLLLANCSLDISIDDVSTMDFAHSTILSTTRGVGDGTTSAVVVVLLKNSDDTAVVSHEPELKLVDSNNQSLDFTNEGVTDIKCSKSDNDGISTCTIKSITVGSKRIGFFNIIIELFGEVYFDPPERNGTFMQIVSSAQIKQDAEGYSVTSHTGTAFSGLRQVESGYTIYTSTTGSITPEE